MGEYLETTKPHGEKNDFEFSQDESEKIPLLPRSAWNSQVTYLKLLLQAKQVLDKRGYFHQDDRKV
jgi:hypothetical protein